MNGDKDASRPSRASGPRGESRGKDAKHAQNKLQIRNSKSETRNSKQKGKTQNTNFKTFKNAGEVLIGRFWVLRIEILNLFSI